MGDTGRKRRDCQMIEDHFYRQAAKYVGKFPNLFAAHVELNMPTQGSHAFGERLDHAGSHDRCRRVTEAEANPPNASFVELLQIRVGDGRVEHGHTSGIGPELDNRIDRGTVIDAVIAGSHDDDPRGPDPIL